MYSLEWDYFSPARHFTAAGVAQFALYEQRKNPEQNGGFVRKDWKGEWNLERTCAILLDFSTNVITTVQKGPTFSKLILLFFSFRL